MVTPWLWLMPPFWACAGVAVMAMTRIGDCLALPERLRRRAYHGGGGAEIPIAGKVSYVIVILFALPGLIWCLGELVAKRN